MIRQSGLNLCALDIPFSLLNALRSTGECICRSNCQGSGCQKESGVIWFAYAKCPTCQCVGSDVKTRFTPSDADLARNQEIEAEQRRQQLMNEEPPREVEEEDEVFDILDWIDDNLNYVFAGAVTLGVLYIFVTIISGGLQSQGGASASDSDSAKRRKDEKNAEDSDKDK